MIHTLTPLGNRVVIIPEEKKEKVGLLHIPDQAQKKPISGLVVAVGSGKQKEDGSFIPMQLKTGDTVLFSKYTGLETDFQDERYLIMFEHDVLARIDELKIGSNLENLFNDNQNKLTDDPKEKESS